LQTANTTKYSILKITKKRKPELTKSNVMGRTDSGRNSRQDNRRREDNSESRKSSKKYHDEFSSFDEPTAIIKKLVKKEKPVATNDFIRLNKYIANAGVCSRREADELIEKGDITVNDKVIKELGFKVTRKDIIKYKGKILRTESKVYILVNKPKDVVTTVEDPHAERTVMDLVAGACDERLYPIGRLDKGTTGVLLLTNDGELAEQLMHPKYRVKKVYQVTLDKPVTKADLSRLVEGFDLEDGFISADAAHYIPDSEDRTEIGVEIHSGRNRIVRRMLEFMGYKIRKLDRVVFAGLTKKNVRRGHWRFLEEKEINSLKMKRFS